MKVTFELYTPDVGRFAGQQVEYIRLENGADVSHRLATPDDKQKFEAAYARFKAGPAPELTPAPAEEPPPPAEPAAALLEPTPESEPAPELPPEAATDFTETETATEPTPYATESEGHE